MYGDDCRMLGRWWRAGGMKGYGDSGDCELFGKGLMISADLAKD